MTRVRRFLLTALPKLALSRATRLLVHIPVPGPLRGSIYGAFARRYGADLTEAAGSLRDYRCMAEFFARPLRDGARPIAATPLVWPADGRVSSSGPVEGDRLPQVKGVDYGLSDLVADPELGARLRGGTQATVYLAPGDYHRVHAPFDAEITAVRHIPGGLFPVNDGAVRSIPALFVRNERVVFDARLPDGRAAAVVMVAALNVSDTEVTASAGAAVARGDELGRFGLGSTVVALIAPGDPGFVPTQPAPVRMGAAAV